MTIQSYIDCEIKRVCPIIGVRFGNLSDKTTWAIQYDDSATPEQIASAEAFLSAFIWDAEIQEIDRKNERDAKYINAPIYKKGYRDYLLLNPNASFGEYMDFLEND